MLESLRFLHYQVDFCKVREMFKGFSQVLEFGARFGVCFHPISRSSKCFIFSLCLLSENLMNACLGMIF